MEECGLMTRKKKKTPPSESNIPHPLLLRVTLPSHHRVPTKDVKLALFSKIGKLSLENTPNSETVLDPNDTMVQSSNFLVLIIQQNVVSVCRSYTQRT